MHLIATERLFISFLKGAGVAQFSGIEQIQQKMLPKALILTIILFVDNVNLY